MKSRSFNHAMELTHALEESDSTRLNAVVIPKKRRHHAIKS